MNNYLIVASLMLLSAFTVTAGKIDEKNLNCYNCFYDKNLDNDLVNKIDIQNINDKDCVEGPYDDVKEKTGFYEKCYKAIALKDGEVLSVHRGGGEAALASFAAQVTRSESDFEVHYCESDLCNSAPATTKSMGLITAFMILILTYVTRV